MRTLAALVLLALAASCGFSPMYGPGPGGAGGGPIGPVEIVGEMPGKAGHTLRQELDRLLAVERGGQAQRLEIRLRERVIPLGLRLDESASRAELRLTAIYILRRPGGGRDIRGQVLSVVNYEVPTAAFGRIAALDDARERAAETLAQRMRADLALRIAREQRT